MDLYDWTCVAVVLLVVAALGVVLRGIWEDSIEPPPAYKPPLADRVAAKLDASPRVIPNWRAGWRWLSTQCMSLAAAITAGWAALPDDWRAMVPHRMIESIVVATLLLGIAGRFVIQSPAEPADDDTHHA